MKKIGIITYHRVRNYGSVLQSYALYKFLEKCGYDAEIIQYEPSGHRTKGEFLGAAGSSPIKRLFYIIASFPLRLKVHLIYKSFRNKNLKLSENLYFCKKDFLEKGCDYDVYVTGSDQVWNSRYNGLNDSIGYAYYFDFTEDCSKRIGYSVSFGEESCVLETDPKIANLINRYLKISVREKSGLQKLKSCGFTDGIHTVDPSLLLDRADYSELFEKNKINTPYLLIYEPQRKNAEKFKVLAQYIAKKYDLKIVKISKEYIKPQWVDIAVYPTVGQWLELFDNASIILTNSFHGIAFSANFKKEFVSIKANSANNRITEFLDFLGLADRMVSNMEECEIVLNNKIDYDSVWKKISDLKESSMDYLIKAIEE